MHKSSFTIALFITASIPVAASASFFDVPSTHSNARAIEYVQEQDIVSGYPDGTFRPDKPINRAEFTKIVVKSSFPEGDADCGLDWYPMADGRPFVDVSTNDWFAHVVCRAYMENVVIGYGDGTFRPAAPINFVEAAKIISKAYDLPSSNDAVWYKPFVEALAQRNAIPLSIVSFENKITRGEMAEMIYRLRAHVTNNPSQTYEGLASKVPNQLRTYTNAEQEITFNYPLSYRVVSDEIVQKYPSGQAWRRIQLDGEAASQARVTVEINPDGYGPFFPDIFLTVTENPDGTLRIVKTEKEPSADTLRLILVKPLQASNGNTYSFRFSHKGDINLEPDFYDILNSVRIGGGGNIQSREWYMDTPPGWSVQENASLPVVDDFVKVSERGTLFQAPEGTEAHIFVAVTDSCPSLSSSFLARGSSDATINGRTFFRAGGSDGAAGSLGEYAVYTSPKNASQCVVIITYYFHSTGDANDEPERSRVKQAMNNPVLRDFAAARR